ncbi:hypothetical protein [Anaerosporobacter faecicola]|uniref:hypothetical protein n=1 Tax=Anaerosporobacter faecicola TaxID=2718714 RepID=UPI00143999B3|nr:hypothetical protein [Anaerosporobacter faecicola]
MNNIEKTILGVVEEKRHILYFYIISVLALVIRIVGFDFMSNDMSVFLIPWYNNIKESGGLSSLDTRIGNYNLLYQTLISFMTYLKINCVYLYKMLSILFDYVLALSIGSFIATYKEKKSFRFEFNVAYTVVLFLPTVVLNSSYWGQCDSIYTAFLILTLLYLYKEKFTLAFLFFGLGLAFKLQTIFLLPFLLCYYIYKKKFSILLFGLSLFSFWFSGIIAYMNGRNILDAFRIYQEQADTYHNMWLNVSSFWVLVGDNYDTLHTGSIIITIILCGLGLYTILENKKKLATMEEYLNTACWFLWTCLPFLPAMHERYTYALDLVLLILCFINKHYIKYAALSILLSLITYGSYLFSNGGLDKWHVLLYVFAWGHYTYSIIRLDQKTNPVTE